ncbi:unnamed protein product, partial [Iphiclides podalirius]
MRSRLFAEPTLNYKKAVELALALEAAERHAEAAGASSHGGVPAPDGSGLGQGAAGLHRVGTGPARLRRPACWRCGKERHAANKCRYKAFVCNKCNQKGHLAQMCTKNVSSGSANRSKFQNYIEKSDSGSDASDGLYRILAVKNSVKDGPYHCK